MSKKYIKYIIGGVLIAVAAVGAERIQDLVVEKTSTFTGASTFESTVNFEGVPTFESTVQFEGVPTFQVGSIFTGTPTFNSTSTFVGEPTFQSTSVFQGEATFESTVQFEGVPTFQVGSIFTGTPTFNSTSTFVGEPTFQSTAVFQGEPTFESTVQFEGVPTFQVGSTFTGTPTFNSTSTFVGEPTFQSTSVFQGVPTFEVASTFEGLPTFEVGLQTDDAIVANQIATPSNPAAGKNKLYFKSDNKLYKLDSGGTEEEVGSGGGGSGAGGVPSYGDIIENFGAETDTTGWTASGSAVLTRTTTAANVGEGDGSFSIDFSADAETLKSDAVAIPAGLYGQNCVMTMQVKGGGTSDIVIKVTDETNTLASVTVSNAVSSYANIDPLSFICPSSGNLQVELLSSGGNPAELFFDSVFVGRNYLIGTVDGAEFVGSIKYNGATSCEWLSTSGTWASFAADSDCNSTTLNGNASAPSTAIPAIRFPNGLSPGHYQVFVSGKIRTGQSTSGNAVCEWRLNDGSTSSAAISTQTNANTGEINAPTILGTFDYTTAKGDTTIELQLQRRSGTQGCVITNESAGNEEFQISVYRYQDAARRVINPDIQGWYIDANIGGANIDLGTSSVSAYATPNNSGLDLVKNGSSAPVGISCSSTNDNTVGATTCSAGSEEPGIVFEAPVAGVYKVCSQSSLLYDSGGSSINAEVTLQLVETANGSQTIIQEGNSRADTRLRFSGASDQTVNHAISTCGMFKFDSSGKKTIRLMREQSVPSASAILLRSDRGTSQGQPDIHFTVERIVPNIQAPVLVDSVQTPGANQVVHLVGGRINTVGATCATLEEQGDFIDSLTYNSTGNCTVNFKTGTFSAQPTCTSNIGNSVGQANITSIGTSSVTFQTSDSSGSAIEEQTYFICIGLK